MDTDRRNEVAGDAACEPYRGWLSEYEAGELTRPLADQVEQHLSGCPTCRRLLASLRRTAAMVEQLADEPPARSMSVRVLGQVHELLAPDLAEAPEILTREELARFLRVSADALAEVIDTIPGFDIGGEVRFRKERVLEWIQEREHQRDRRAIYSQLRAV